jgi:ribonuclease R
LTREPTAGARAKARLDSGYLKATPTGFGFVATASGTVMVPRRDLSDALDGDLVEVAILTPEGDERPRGRVARILERKARRLVGTLDRAGRFLVDDVSFSRPLTSDGRAGAGADVCGTELCPLGQKTEVRVVHRFGRRGEPRVEIDATLWRESVDERLSEDAEREARIAAESREDPDGARREDLRHVPFVTIDPPDAEDHDDALYAERLEDGRVRCWIAIADVSSFVRAGSVLDEEARRRGASLYFPRRVVPMLPLALSAGAASLVAGEERRAVVVAVMLTVDGDVESSRIAVATIRTRAKLTYDDAARVLRQEEALEGPTKEHARTIELLDRVAGVLRGKRGARGALLVNVPEVRAETDPETGALVSLRRIDADAWRIRAGGLVEEHMLLANGVVARFLGADSAPFRGHAAPSPERLTEVARAAADGGVELSEETLNDPAALRAAVHGIKDEATRMTASIALLGALRGAEYDEEATSHFALATSEYVHFTSPIRRYADILVHRVVRAKLFERPAEGIDVDATLLNENQRRGRRIQSEIAALYGALAISTAVGRELVGKVVRVARKTVLVAMEDPPVTIRCERPASGELSERDEARVRVDRVDIATRSVHGTLCPARA